ncbi:hypothetical protein BDV19DRAFT_391752 [Aspergillus venezuelensis]
MLWTQLGNLIPKSLLRLVGDCSCLLATAGENVGVLEYLNSVGHAFGTQSSVMPFNFVHGRLISVSAYLGSRKLVLYWKERLKDKELLDASKSLSDAVYRADERAVSLLLEGFEDRFYSRAIVSSLRWASKMGYARIITHLLSHPTCDVNYRNGFGETPLMNVADSGPAVAALCKDADLDVDLQNHLGEAALDIFIKECRPEALAALLKHPGIDINR